MEIVKETDMGAIVFQEDEKGVIHEQWFIPAKCGHAVEDPDCEGCLEEQLARNEARRKFNKRNQAVN